MFKDNIFNSNMTAIKVISCAYFLWVPHRIRKATKEKETFGMSGSLKVSNSHSSGRHEMKTRFNSIGNPQDSDHENLTF